MKPLLTHNRIGGFLLLIFCLTYAALSQRIPSIEAVQSTTMPSGMDAASMPFFLSILGILLSLWVIFDRAPTKNTQPAKDLNWWRFIMFLALMLGYGWGIRPLGFLLSTSLFLLIGFRILGEKRITLLVAVSCTIALAFWLLMSQLLGVHLEPLPSILRLLDA